MGLFQDLKDRGIWRGYERHVVMLEPVLRRMTERGMPVDPSRYKEVEARLQTDLASRFEEMQQLVPDAVKPFHPTKGYKKVPKDLSGCVLHTFEDGERYVRLDEWKPSNKGLIRFMRYRGHEVPKALKSGKETTNELEIERLAKKTGDPLYSNVIEYRKAGTVLNNHMENWRPGPDGRVHGVFYFDPATGQLSSRRPNLQNAPKHTGEYAKLFRSMVKPRPGHIIMEADYSGFHVQTLGFEAQDLDLMRIGRIDLHSFVTADFLHLKSVDKLFAMPDDELGDFLKWVKKEHKHTRDAKVKHAILGYNNGMGYRKLYNQYREFFSNEKEAKKVVSMMDSIFPKSKRYRDAICQQAHEQGYLISRHGYIRYFWEVFRWQGGEWTHGDDHEAALSFFTQNDAHGELKDRILTLASLGLDVKYGLLNTIHDSLIFECPLELIGEAVKVIKDIMESPSTVLIDPIAAPNGLVVKVDVQAGPDWSSMKSL